MRREYECTCMRMTACTHLQRALLPTVIRGTCSGRVHWPNGGYAACSQITLGNLVITDRDSSAVPWWDWHWYSRSRASWDRYLL